MNWYAIHTKSRQEEVAEASLQRLGLETLYPRVKQKRVIRRREQSVLRSLFPGYIFAAFDLETHFRSVNFAQGVRKVVSFGTLPAIVDVTVIESIKTRLQNGYVKIERPLLRPGQVVQIKQGLMRGLDAIFERDLNDHQRVVLLLQLLSSQARVVVRLDQVAGY